MHNIWELMSKPDNIPIVGLLVLVILYTWWSFHKALKNDRQGFLDEEKLKQEFDVIIPFLKDQSMDRPHVIDYLKSYFNDVYGNTDTDVLFMTINKEVSKFFS